MQIYSQLAPLALGGAHGSAVAMGFFDGIHIGQADGTFAYTSTANNGFWCEANGNIGNWGDMPSLFPIYCVSYFSNQTYAATLCYL